MKPVAKGWGDTFLNDYESTLRSVVAAPERPSLFLQENRKKNFKRFPYAIVYSCEKEILYVKAVMHLHRRPNYWKYRR
ncbi:MAG: hypothetical protein B9S32_15940 [Verrucomicrobia bacterium Tous-C9LFEB]|nr:MAG: hypothetical protein B9S32_15940 [Verrucomicrobia bacterium Tous-C9LFEB]